MIRRHGAGCQSTGTALPAAGAAAGVAGVAHDAPGRGKHHQDGTQCEYFSIRADVFGRPVPRDSELCRSRTLRSVTQSLVRRYGNRQADGALPCDRRSDAGPVAAHLVCTNLIQAPGTAIGLRCSALARCPAKAAGRPCLHWRSHGAREPRGKSRPIRDVAGPPSPIPRAARADSSAGVQLVSVPCRSVDLCE